MTQSTLNPAPSPQTSAAWPAPSALLELLKPITWFAPMWAFLCGAISSGVSFAGNWEVVLVGMALAGPLVCGMSQAANDWCDRHVDAINEPHRPIPSGRMPGRWGLYVAWGWTVPALLAAAWLGPVVLMAAVLGVALAWAYSAPPVRLKANGWLGPAVVAACYEGLPWITGAAAMLGAAEGGAGWPDARIFALAALYSIGAHGIMTLNDFKAVEGDAATGVRSLPVVLGPDRAARLACWVMLAPQAVVVGLLILWGAPVHAAIVAGLLLAQIALTPRLLSDPRANAPWWNATGTSLYVLGMMASAWALRALTETPL